MSTYGDSVLRRGHDDRRCEEVAKYIVVCGATVRSAAEKFGMSKSTVHKEVTSRLRTLNPGLFSEVREVLDKNKAERHLRGGEATRQRYEKEREKLLLNDKYLNM